MTQSSNEQEVPELKGAAFLAECKKALLCYPSTVRVLILSPSKFFQSPAFEEPPEYRLAQATTFLVVTAVIATLADYFSNYSGSISYYFLQLVQKVFMLIGWNYLFAMVMHVLLKMFRSKGAFIDTLVCANYCSAQFIVVGLGEMIKAAMGVIIPYGDSSESILQWFAYSCVAPGITTISMLLPLYGCFIFVRGIQALHKMSRTRTSIAVYGPVILFFLPAVIGAVIVALVLGMLTRH